MWLHYIAVQLFLVFEVLTVLNIKIMVYSMKTQ
jgi:hypothetical protein